MPREKGHKGYWIKLFTDTTPNNIFSGESLSQDYSLLRTFAAAAALSPRLIRNLNPRPVGVFYAPGYPVNHLVSRTGVEPVTHEFSVRRLYRLGYLDINGNGVLVLLNYTPLRTSRDSNSDFQYPNFVQRSPIFLSI